MALDVSFVDKRGVKMVLIVFAVVSLLYISSLVFLYLSVSRFKNFWTQKAKDQGEITYLALGDSAAQGIGATSPMRGYVGLLAKRVEAETGKSVRVVNISKTGATLDDYLQEQAPQVKNIKAEIVTIEIGANDIKTYNPEQFANEFTKVLDTLPDGAYVANMPLFNSRPGSTENAKRASVLIEQLVSERKQFQLVDLQKYTSDNQSIFGFAPDFFHPNNLSYKNWANAFWSEVQPDLE